MQTTLVKENQTLHDLSIALYGTCEAVGELLRLNPAIENDARALSAAGIDTISDKAFYLDLPVAEGSELRFDPDSLLRRDNILKELTADINTYSHGTNH